LPLSPRFLGLLEAEDLGSARGLDVGCGTGRLTFWLAARARQVVGLDRDPAAVAEARRVAAQARIGNVEFIEGDVEREEYLRFAPDIVTAHLCASDAIIERAARALSPGHCLGMVAFHVDQWKETSRVSRFAYDEARMELSLKAQGLVPEALEVEREVKRFGSVEEGLAAGACLEDIRRFEGRWFRYIAFLEGGGRTLTRAHLIVKARKP
jgi:SAM-dependent methyltransferase